MDLRWIANGRRFRTLIDIGANSGEYGAFLAETFEIENIIAFEPQSKHAPKLAARGFEVHSIALGDSDHLLMFHISGYDPASSALPITAKCLSEWPQTAEETQVEVPQTRMDDIFCGRKLAGDILIKVDVQGFEGRVIAGGMETFRSASVVLIETIFVPLYQGQSSFSQINAKLEKCGFELAGFTRQSTNENGQPLFAHCIYLRS